MKTALAISAALLLLAGPALADDDEEPDFGRGGFYLGAGGTAGIENLDVPGTADSSFGVHGRIGYRSAEMLAEEIQFEWQNGFDLSRGGEVDAWALTLNLRWYLTTGRIQPFLVTGVGAARIKCDPCRDSRDVALLGRLGGGVDFYITESIGVTFDATYLLPAENNFTPHDVQWVSLGLGMLYRF
jgi:opacity protein-like surface antigen